jgi:hypothetical protein
MTKPRPIDPAWEKLREPEYGSVWDRFYEKFDFHASMRPEHWPSFVEPSDSVTWDIAPLLNDRSNSYPDAEAEVSAALHRGILDVIGDDEFAYALDWQHTCYRFRPALASTRPETWRVAALPDGDYFLFVARDLRFGWLSHPWEQSICVFGDLIDAVRPFMDAQPWPVLRVAGKPTHEPIDAAGLTRLWERRWPATPLAADELKSTHAARWFRVHSLPQSKRYADSDAERAEILARHHTVLKALGADATDAVLCVVARWGSAESVVHEDPDLERAHAGGWLWRSMPPDDADDIDDDVGEPPPELNKRWCHLFVSEGPLSKWDGVLSLVADWRASGVMILTRDLSWIYHPYDGGADVIAPTTAERDQLRAQFASWLSHRSDGL